MKTMSSKFGKTEIKMVKSVILLVGAVMVLHIQTIAKGVSISGDMTYSAISEALDSEVEGAITIESWMIDPWITPLTISQEPITEQTLEIEDWMLNSGKFEAENFLATEISKHFQYNFMNENESGYSGNFSTENDIEESIDIESWMLNESLFNRNILFETEIERSAEIENWMLNDTLFELASAEGKLDGQTFKSGTDENVKVTYIEYKDRITGNTFLFRLADIEDKELVVENWMLSRSHWKMNRK